MIRPPPSSPPFPYPTLFRSKVMSAGFLGSSLKAGRLRAVNDASPLKVWQVQYPPHFERRCIDRKSTRLNSSHPSISYAVFCLKKKKKKKKHTSKYKTITVSV